MIKKNYTTFNIAKMLNVYSSTVARWIDERKLKAFVTPGGHRRVNGRDLYVFLKKHNMPIPAELTYSDKKKILVVDDNLEVLNSIVKILETKKKKYKIFTATDGFQAGYATRQYNPDLLILDIVLPGIDGFKVCELIRKQNKVVKILAITGYPSQENKKKILEVGADAYLPKPFKKKEMMENIELLLKESEVISKSLSLNQ